MAEIPVPDITVVETDRIDPETGKKLVVPHLGDVVKVILATSPAIPATNIKQLSEQIGISYTNVRQWFHHGTSPNLENLSKICGNLNTDVIQFLLQWEGFAHTTASRHGVVLDRIAGVLSNPQHAQKLLAILLEEKSLGLLESFLDQTAAQLGVDPDHPVRSIDRPAPPRKKSRKGA